MYLRGSFIEDELINDIDLFWIVVIIWLYYIIISA